MKGYIKTRRETTLVLNEEETAWLIGLMQNPLTTNPDGESQKDNEMRRRFWKILGEKE